MTLSINKVGNLSNFITSGDQTIKLNTIDEQLSYLSWQQANPDKPWELTADETEELKDLELFVVFSHSRLKLDDFDSFDDLKNELITRKNYLAQIDIAKSTDHLTAYFFEGSVEYSDPHIEGFFGDKIAKKDFLAIFENANDKATIQIGDIKGTLVLDLNNNNQIDTDKEFLRTHELLAMDSNRDGLIDLSDQNFKHLKIAIDDDQGGYKLLSLASVASTISLQDYLKPSDDLAFEYSGTTVKELFMRYTDPVYSYERFDNDQLRDMLESMPQTDDGWVMRGEDTEAFFASLAYQKNAANGSSYLQKANSFSSSGATLANGYLDEVSKSVLEKELISRFDLLYNRYHELNTANQDSFKTAEMAFLEKEFERITHIDFSLENMEKIKSNIAQGKIAESFADLDVVVGIKQDGDNYLLRFNSGRTVSVSSLYFNTGDFIPFDGDKRASIVMPDQLGDGELTIDEADQIYETLAVKINDKLTLLKDAGIVAIHKREFKELDRIALLFEMEDGSTKLNLELYKITDNKTEIKTTAEAIREILDNPYIEKQSAKKGEIGLG